MLMSIVCDIYRRGVGGLRLSVIINDVICSKIICEHPLMPLHNDYLSADMKDIMVSHRLLRRHIMDETVTVNAAFILLIVCGLPDCGKTDLLMNLLRRVVTKQPNSPAHDHDPKAIKQCYELAAVGQSNQPNCRVHYTETTKDTCVLYSFESALKHHYYPRGQQIKRFHEPSATPELIFKDEDLNQHFLDVFKCLHNNHDVRPNSTYPPTPKKSPEEKTLSEWEKSIPSGIALINIWDLKASKSGYNFLPALCGYLHSGHVWSFLDLERDAPNLHKVLDAPDVPDEDKIWRWRARIHHYLRFAMLASSKDPSFYRHNVCSLFATHGGDFDESNRKKLLNKVKYIAPQLGVDELADIENVRVIQKIGESKEKAKESDMVLQELCDSKMREALKSPLKIPLSCFFLRTSYYKKDPLYVMKAELQAKAKELNMSDETFQRYMCNLNTSVGSLIDVSLIDPASPYVIMNPVKFVHDLDKIFLCKDYPRITDHGLVTEGDAKLIYGDDSNFFMEVLCSAGTAIKVKTERVLVDGSSPEGEYCYIVPGARTSKPLTGYEPSALHLMMRSIDLPLRNILLDFTSSFMSIDENATIVFTGETPVNVNYFESVPRDLSGGSIKFSAVQPGNVLQFCLPSDKVSKELCCSIVKSCHKLMSLEQTHDFKYNLCIMCSDHMSQTGLEDPLPHHLFSSTDPTCKTCKDVYNQPLVQTWKSVVHNVSGKF